MPTPLTAFPAVIDNSMRRDFFNCPTKFMHRHTRGLQPADGSENVDKHFGGAFAVGLETTRKAFWTSDGRVGSTEAIERGVAAAIAFYGTFVPPATSYKTPARLAGALKFCFEQWPLASDLTPVEGGIECSFKIPLPINHPTNGECLYYAGRFDMLAGDKNGRYYVVDEKTTSRLGDSWYLKWDMDSQMSGYIWSVLQQNWSCKGIEVLAQVRGISILKNDYGHAEVPIVRSPHMLHQWYEQLLRDVQRMVASYNAGEWDLALGEACSLFMRPCEYQRLCTSADPERLIDGNYKVEFWHPLERK